MSAVAVAETVETAATHPATQILRRLCELHHVGATTEMKAILVECVANRGPLPKSRKKEVSGPTRTRPRDARDWWLMELDLPDASKSNIERSLHAAGITRDELLTAGALCKWSAADLQEFGVSPAAFEQLKGALAKVRLRLRGERQVIADRTPRPEVP